MAQFCRRFVKNLNIVLSPLYDLTKANITFDWSIRCQNAFDKIKEMLTQSPILTSPTDKSTFILETDASNIGFGSCLKIEDDGTEYIVNYESGKFSDTQLRWNVVEKEAHAYLLGKKFTIRTDSRILSFLHEKREPKNRKLLNWALELSEFDYNIVHIPSTMNGICDCLSRLDEICPSQHNSPVIGIEELHKMQQDDPDISNALIYLQKQKKNFDITKLGSLKRYRKKLKIDDTGILMCCCTT